MLSINVNVWCLLQAKIILLYVRSFQGLTKRSDRFETMKLYRIQVSEKLILQNILLSLIY